MAATDTENLAAKLQGVMEQILSKMNAIVPSESTQMKLIDIDDYEDRMKISGIEKFGASSYISVINFYLTQGDLAKRNNAKGALLLYVESDNGGKFYKALGFAAADDEDDVSMMEANGKFCQLIVDAFKNELASLGYANIYMSEPDNYKNSAMHGIEYSVDQKTKTELSFFYWKHKAIVVELTLAPKK